MIEFTHDEIVLMLQSLEFTKSSFENYKYDNYEFRASQLKRVDDLRAKIIKIKNSQEASL